MSPRARERVIDAPEENGFVQGESPRPGPVANGSRRGTSRGVPGASLPPPESPSVWRALWSLSKLATGVLVVVGAAAAVAWGAHHYALTSPRFAIKRIEVGGVQRKPESQIANLAHVKLGDNIFALDLGAAERSLLEDPWIKEVRVTRALPSTVRIDLVEREAGALASIGDSLYLLTRTGEPFKQLEEGDPYDLPVLTGVTAEDLSRDRARAVERIATGLEIVRHWDRIPASQVHPVQEVHLSAGGDAVLTVGKAGIVLFIGKGPWRKKLLMAERVMGQLERKGRVPGIVFADNQAHPEKVVVRMR